MTAVKETAEQGQYLTFQLAGEEYAIGILGVKEIIEYDTITTVPATPACIRGVINLRGNVVPVVDLAVKFGLPPGEAFLHLRRDHTFPFEDRAIVLKTAHGNHAIQH